MSRKTRPSQRHGHLPPLSAEADIGLAWFTRSAWYRLVAVAEDRDALDDTFEEWERNAFAAIQDLEALGRRIRKVPIDVDALVTWCRQNHRRIDRAARADFVIHRLQSEPHPKGGSVVNRQEASSVSPYREAWQWIEQHPATGSAIAFAKLLLSLWNPQAAFSVRECLDELDNARAELAVRVVIHFEHFGEDRELVEIGSQVCQAYPRLWEMGREVSRAKQALREKWRLEDAQDSSD